MADISFNIHPIIHWSC